MKIVPEAESRRTCLFFTGIEKLLKNLTVLVLQRNTNVLCLSMEGPRGSDHSRQELERLMAATGHHLEVMMVTCHQLGFAGEFLPKTSFLRQKKTCIVLAREACEGPNTPDQARRLCGETRSTLLSQKVCLKAPPQNHIIHLVFSGDTAGKSSSFSSRSGRYMV